MADLVLELYLVGHAPGSQAALANLQRICDEHLTCTYEIEVVDVLENPQAAEDANIIATPTLIRRAPPPVRRIVGDLSVTEAVLRGLGLNDDQPRPAQEERPDDEPG